MSVHEESLEIMLDRLLPRLPASTCELPSADRSVELLRDVIEQETRTIHAPSMRGGTQRIPLSRRPRSITPTHGVTLVNMRPEVRSACKTQVASLLEELRAAELEEQDTVRLPRCTVSARTVAAVATLWVTTLVTCVAAAVLGQ